MSKFRKKGKKGQPPVNTAALPDIVFMLLFFFMVATRPKEKEPTNLEMEIPESVIAIELNKDDETDYIWAGYPLDGGANAVVEVFLDDQLEVDYMSKIGPWKLSQKPADMEVFDVSTILKIDDDVNMKTVANIKDALSDPKVKGYRIIYSTKNKLGDR
ncbi:MAG: biopolymer transporter ExbD [Putridiphycobacter sp.]|jgi:biopolymer transport protein ExbD|nr:biopolymer transporter ExbD [Putridiphycobacter sp.]